MAEKDDFFVGWQENVPRINRRPLRVFVITIISLAIVVVFLTVQSQKPFSNHVFELGNITEVSGVYYDNPFPLLVADSSLPEGVPSKDILLVGYGKSGAKGIMSDIQSDREEALAGRRLTLRGTLIYGDGKTVMELTKKKKSIVKIDTSEKEAPNLSSVVETNSGTYAGEIIDPKCFFGVMKPGHGKVHKSCAIRCISGGIPPVLRSDTGEGKYDYFLLLDEKGQAINEEVLDFIAESVVMEGREALWNNWKVLYVKMNSLKRTNI